MTKPLVFNYGHYEKLRDYANDLLLDNEKLMADNRKLRQEVTELKQLNDGYVKIIAKNQETNNKLMASVQKQTGGDYISRADAIEAIEKKFPEPMPLSLAYPIGECVAIISALPSADVVTIHNDGTLEVKVPNAQKVGRVLVVDTDSHIGGGLFYQDDAVQGKWIPIEETIPTYDGGEKTWITGMKCSNCGKLFDLRVGYYYCPSCGARMKGGEDE